MLSRAEVRAPAAVDRWRVRVNGVVQGVGYRPFVYRLAREHDLNGWVLNDPEGVLLEVEGSTALLHRFVEDLTSAAPPQARVEAVDVLRGLELVDDGGSFTIRESARGGVKDAIVPADSCVCADCLAELRDPSDRRHGYAFINCTNCGPRYSIVRALPYDRPQTTMAAFEMCEDCAREYADPLDRRYHAQPNACPACGPQLLLAGADGLQATGDAALDAAAAALAAGRIVAIKSIGGFHLAVDARDADAVARLRWRKRRDAKPFALMVRDVAAVHAVAQPNAAELELMTSPARPIVLVRKRPGALPEAIAPRNPNLGIMLPSAPQHHLVVDRPGLDTLVMTSGNISGYPIAYRNEDALSQLFAVADAILYNDRDIEIRVDDSVVRVSTHPELEEPLVTFLRRSRGYAPYPIDLGVELEPIVAYGAELKTTVALTRGSRVYLSQHIGDLKNDETFESHRRTARHLADLHELRPRAAVCDTHPQFRSTRATLQREDWRVDSVLQVQHHHAHMAACIAENRLQGTVVGVVFDGAGYGEDGTIWGCEFLVGDCAEARRVAHLRPIALLGGDRAVHEPIRTGFALALDAFDDRDAAVRAFPVLRELDEQRLQVFETMMRRRVNSPPASSAGRLFDGVAALVGLAPKAEYEAHGPIELEGLLGRDLELSPSSLRYRFASKTRDGVVAIDQRPVIRAVAADLAAGADAATISRRFHSGVVDVVVERCLDAAAGERRAVVLSGGVFLNEFLLVNCLVELRRAGLDAHCHRHVPPNDGGIALGQVAVASARLSTA